MKTTQEKIHAHFNRFNKSLFLPNEYTPPKGQKGLRIAKTVKPDEVATFNEVFINVKRQLL